MDRRKLLPLIILLTGLLCVACANIGRPEGGPKDELPPAFVRSNPAPGAVDVTPGRLTLYFDENIQLEDAFNKVVVSPAQVQPPTVIGNGHRVTVIFRDSLKSNTTYTIDFADAIKDLNEGNIIDGFAIDFSTGPDLDSLRISGIVLQASNLEPAQGMLVGAYITDSDSDIMSRPFDRIARTNQYGQFTLRNLRDTVYHIYAVNDLNRDFHWDSSEDVAFLGYGVRPTVSAIEVTDTLRSNLDPSQDSIVSRQGIKFLPNDLLMTWFNENKLPQYLKNYTREDRRYINLEMAAPADSLPVITIAEGPHAGRDVTDWAMLEASPGRDSLQYWIRDAEILAMDTLRLSVRYLRTDTAGALSAVTDTLRFLYREPKSDKKKDKSKNENADTDSITLDSLGNPLPAQPANFLTLSNVTGSTHEVYMPLIFRGNTPLANIDTAAVHLEIKVDTLWQAVDHPWHIETDSVRNHLTQRRIDYPWTPGERYRLKVDSIGITDIFGDYNKPYNFEFSVRDLEEYSNITFMVTGLDSVPAFIELLASNDEAKYTLPVDLTDYRAVFRNLAPGEYYARLVLDANDNGKWDTGDIAAQLQPEEVYYFPKKLNLRRNWDLDQAWDIYETPVDLQKPYAIKKNRPKLKRGETAPEEDEDEDDGWDDPFMPNPNRNNNSTNGNRRPTNGRFQTNTGAGNLHAR